MKKTVGLFVLFVLMAGTAHAQTKQEASCKQEETLVPTEAWVWMTLEQQESACRIVARSKALQQQYLASKPQEGPRWFSPKLAVAGILTTAAGVGLTLHFGEDTKNILGNQYCVSDYGDVAYGGCGSPTQTKVGLILIGTGVTMVFIGTRHVKVSPMVGPGVKGVSGSIKWGGKK